MVIEIPDEALRGLGLTESQALLELAVGLFTEQRVTLGRAAGIARLRQQEFQRELGRRGIAVPYDVEDLQADLLTLAALREKNRIQKGWKEEIGRRVQEIESGKAAAIPTKTAIRNGRRVLREIRSVAPAHRNK